MKRASQFTRPFFVVLVKDVLFRHYADGAGAFFALADLKLHGLTFFEVFEAAGLNLRMMHEEVLSAVIRDNKSETLFAVKPLYFTGTHLYSFGPYGPQKYFVPHVIFVKRILLRDGGICSIEKHYTVKPGVCANYFSRILKYFYL